MNERPMTIARVCNAIFGNYCIAACAARDGDKTAEPLKAWYSDGLDTAVAVETDKYKAVDQQGNSI